jgi:adenine phosphoribosyltransferase
VTSHSETETPSGRPAVVDSLFATMESYPDFPSPGILFRDLSPALADAITFGLVVDTLADILVDIAPPTSLVAGVEARGFSLAAAVAARAGTGMLAIRKAGKLPGTVMAEPYDLEYGSASLELRPSTVTERRSVYLLDDVLATGGTLAAAGRLLERCGYSVSGIGVVLELEALEGRRQLGGYDVRSILTL